MDYNTKDLHRIERFSSTKWHSRLTWILYRSIEDFVEKREAVWNPQLVEVVSGHRVGALEQVRDSRAAKWDTVLVKDHFSTKS